MYENIIKIKKLSYEDCIKIYVIRSLIQFETGVTEFKRKFQRQKRSNF